MKKLTFPTPLPAELPRSETLNSPNIPSSTKYCPLFSIFNIFDKIFVVDSAGSLQTGAMFFQYGVNFQSCSRKIEILDVDKQLLKHLPVCAFVDSRQHLLQVKALLGSQKGFEDLRSHLREEVAARSDYVNLHE